MSRSVRRSAPLLALLCWATLLCEPTSATSAACARFTGGAGSAYFAAFAGHGVRATYQWCNFQPAGFVGPFRVGLKRVDSVRITLPTRVPGAWGETAFVNQAPYLYSSSVPLNGTSRWKYRFSVHQGHVAVPFGSDYDFELQVTGVIRPAARICFVGRSCSAWQG
jgi:hypothetical protein